MRIQTGYARGMTTQRAGQLEREAIANRPRHWVRLVTACNSHCLFCLDSDTPRNVYLPVEEIKGELRRGREELDAWKVILSGGEASLHPEYMDVIRYAKEIGYGRVQTVTNGWRYADKDFLDDALAAGLQEITYSLHGHTVELHDRLTVHPGSFKRICKSILRSLRHPMRPIVNVDIVINKQNVGVLDKIVEFAIRLGVTEFDLLHVIPQADAFKNREDMFYDVRDHMEVLHKVFRLNRHPRFVIWTNRFPVEYLEGLEDLIQDPHKMLDEVNGRRFQVRNYLDQGEPLACRDAERCPLCFIEPFCTTMDRTVAAQRDEAVDVWWVGDDDWSGELPFGATLLGVRVDSAADLSGSSLFARVGDAAPLPALESSVVVAHTPAQLSAWLHQLPDGIDIDVELNAQTGPWMLDNRAALAAVLDRVRIVQPWHEHMAEAVETDLRDPAAFFTALDLRVRVAGLPACLAPNTVLVAPRHRLDAAMFDGETGRLSIRELARHHIVDGYTTKSVRCRDCALTDRCDGAHINWLRDQGLGKLTPLTGEGWAADAGAQVAALHPAPIARLANGKLPEAPAPSLPGFGVPGRAVRDPLAVIAEQVAEKRARRREELLERARRERAGEA
jgi:pyruvate-formate lyase-activating enzyme